MSDTVQCAMCGGHGRCGPRGNPIICSLCGGTGRIATVAEPAAVVEPPRDGTTEDPIIVCCEDCGLAYGSDGWIECVLPNDDWAKISTSHDEGGILCITCIARRLKRAGISDVPVMLCGTEAIRAADQDEAFDRGWKVAERAAKEQADEIERLRSALSAAQQDSERANEVIEDALQSMREPMTLDDARRGRTILTHHSVQRALAKVDAARAAVSPSPEPHK